MFSILIANLATLIVTVRRNILSSLLTTTLILALIICWSARDAIGAYLSGNVVAQQQHVNAERDRMIQRRLHYIIGATNASRVVIREFSARPDSSGENVPFITTTHWVVAPGISEPPESLKQTRQADFGHMLDPLFRGQCAQGSPEQIANPLLRQMVQEQTGALYWYMCPLNDLDGKTIGYISVSYLSNGAVRPNEQTIFAFLRFQAVSLSGYIDNRKAPDPWYQQYLSS